MSKQIDISFPKYSFDMASLTISQLQAELAKCYETIEKQKRSITAYKGHFTRKQRKNNP